MSSIQKSSFLNFKPTKFLLKPTLKPLYNDQISFRSTSELTEVMQSTTSFFRDGSIKALINIIDDKFSNMLNLNDNTTNQNKIDVDCFACSDGTELYSIILGLIDKYGIDKVKNNFNFNGYDVSNKMIQRAKNNEIYLSSIDIDIIKNIKNIKFEDYFELTNERVKLGFDNYRKCKVKPALADFANFHIKNFFDYSSYNQNTSPYRVILFRNALYHYYDEGNRLKDINFFEKIINKLCHFLRTNMPINSIIAFGALDNDFMKKITSLIKDNFVAIYNQENSDERGTILYKYN